MGLLDEYKVGNQTGSPGGLLESYKAPVSAPSGNPPGLNIGGSRPDWNQGLDTLKSALPVGGAILGGAGGAALGLFAGGPVGAWAGGAVGAGLGSSAGEAGKQLIEKAQGLRGAVSPGDITKTGLEYGALEAVGGPLLKVAGKGIEAVGSAIYKSAIPTSIKEAGLLQAYKANVPFMERFMNVLKGTGTAAPTTVADTAFSKGIMGTESMIGIQGKRVAGTLWKDLINPQLESSQVKVNMPTFFKEAEQQIIKNNPERVRQSTLIDALNAMKDDYHGVKDVSLAELQKFKEGWAKFVPEKAYRGKPIAGAFNDLQDMVAGKAREIIYKSLGPEVKQAYFDYGNLKGIQELGQKAMTGGKFKGGFGSFWSAVKDMALTPVSTAGGMTIYKAGQGVEMMGKPGARVVRDLFFSPMIGPSQ